MLLRLFLKPVGLDAELNSASNGAIFNRGHRTKNVTCLQNTGFSRRFSRYILSGFAILLGLFLKPLGLGAEFHSASNGAIFSRGRRAKRATCPKKQVFQESFQSISCPDSLYYLDYF
jgi:hypothetical protein